MSAQPEPGAPTPPAGPEYSSGGIDSVVPYMLCLIVAIGIAYGGWTLWQVRQNEIARSEAIPANAIGPPLTDFDLTESDGKTFRSVDMRGRVWVVSYFFTTCPGQCLRLNANLQVLNAEPQLKDVTWVSISCDPDTDTLAALKAYSERFQADPRRWLFCRGDLDYVKRIAKGQGIYMSLKGHQDAAIVIDKTGKVRGVFDATSEITCNRLKAKLLECLAEKAPSELVTAAPANGKSS